MSLPPLPSLFRPHHQHPQRQPFEQTPLRPLSMRGLETNTTSSGALLLRERESVAAFASSAAATSTDNISSEKSKKRPRARRQRADKENAAPPSVDDSGSGSGGASQEAVKPRKPTYLLQKEERDVLVDDVRVLEQQLEALRLRAGLPTRDDHAGVATTRAQNFDLEEQIHASRLYLAKLQSLVMHELHTPEVDPLATFIHLPRDTDQRRAILRGLRDHKLRRAEEVAHAWLHHLDYTQTYVSEERFMTPEDGIYHFHRIEIQQFPNFRSARQLYDAMSIFFYNWEISVSELLDQLAIREDSDEIDPTIWNQRIVTVAEDVGCPEELNTVVFARFRNGNDDHDHDGNSSANGSNGSASSPVGIITFDTVDIDDLYPYKPHERTCKFFQAVYLVTELHVPGTTRPLPILKHCSFGKQLPPQFALAPGVEDKLRQHVSRWTITLLKFLRAYRAPESASTSMMAP